MPTLKVNEIIAYSGNTLSLGTSGNTVTLPANVTFNALSGNVYIPNGIIKLDAITVSATTTFNLTYGGSAYSPASANACLVSVNGVIQTPGTAFTISGSQIIFTSALSATDTINFIIVLAAPYTLNVPGGGTVGFNEITSNLITGATAVTVPATDDVLLCYDTSATALRKITFANFGNAPAFMAFQNNSSTQSISNTVWTEVTLYNTELFDSDSAFNTTTCRFTPQVAGKYFFTAQIYIQSGAAANFNGIIIAKNGSISGASTTELFWQTALATGTTDFRVNGFLTMNGTSDYVSVFINQQTGGSKTIGGSSVQSTMFFGGHRLIGV